MSSCDRSHFKPSEYGADAGHQHLLSTRWDDPFGRAIRQYAPRIFPGTPPQAFVGFTVGAYRYNEDTATSSNPAPFHELGPFQTPGGPKDGPAPNPDPNARNNAYAAIARSDELESLLGRSASITNWASDLEGQAVVGLLNLRNGARAVAARLPASIRPHNPGSQWNVALAFMSFVSWLPSYTEFVRRHERELASVSEQYRWGEFLYLYAKDIQNGMDTGSYGSHSNGAYDLMRVMQKLAAGEVLTQHTQGDVGWFYSGLNRNTRVGIEALVVGAACGGGLWSGILSPPSTIAGKIVVVLGIAALAGTGYLVWREGGVMPAYNVAKKAVKRFGKGAKKTVRGLLP